MTKKGQQMVDDAIRDQTFAAMRHQNDNNICIDCQKKNPKWASIHLGVHLCIDCAGKHRQYGVVTSFVKSTNLDKWNYKQLLFMQKGSNARALQYFRKCGVITNGNRHIDYKSPIVQKYKAILTEQVELELNGGEIQAKKVQEKPKSQQNLISFDQTNDIFNQQSINKQIPQAQTVVADTKDDKGAKKKKGKKKMGNQIIIEDFESMTFDDGVSKEQKDKIVKSYEATSTVETKAPETGEQQVSHPHSQPAVQIPKPEPKQLTEQQVKHKMQQLKAQKNVKSISSEQFKGQQYDNVQIKQKFNQFSGATSISSSSFNNEPEDSGKGEAMQKLKDVASNLAETGSKLYSKLSGLWSRN